MLKNGFRRAPGSHQMNMSQECIRIAHAIIVLRLTEPRCNKASARAMRLRLEERGLTIYSCFQQFLCGLNLAFSDFFLRNEQPCFGFRIDLHQHTCSHVMVHLIQLVNFNFNSFAVSTAIMRKNGQSQSLKVIPGEMTCSLVGRSNILP